MRNFLLICLIFLAFNSLSQVEIGINIAGGGSVNMLQPIVNKHVGTSIGIEAHIDHRPKEKSILLRISSHIGNYIYYEKSHYHPQHIRYYASADHNHSMIVGVGLESSKERYFRFSGLIQLGAWHSLSDVSEYGQSYSNQTHYSNRIFQVVGGPSMMLKYGKKRLQGTLTYQELFFSQPRINSMQHSRITRLGLGIL